MFYQRIYSRQRLLPNLFKIRLSMSIKDQNKKESVFVLLKDIVVVILDILYREIHNYISGKFNYFFGPIIILTSRMLYKLRIVKPRRHINQNREIRR